MSCTGQAGWRMTGNAVFTCLKDNIFYLCAFKNKEGVKKPRSFASIHFGRMNYNLKAREAAISWAFLLTVHTSASGVIRYLCHLSSSFNCSKKSTRRCTVKYGLRTCMGVASSCWRFTTSARSIANASRSFRCL